MARNNRPILTADRAGASYVVAHDAVGGHPRGTILTGEDLQGVDVRRLEQLGAIQRATRENVAAIRGETPPAEDAGDVAAERRAELEAMDETQLRQVALEMQLADAAQLSKAELVAAILQHEVGG